MRRMSKAHKGMTLNEVKERYLPNRTREELERTLLPPTAVDHIRAGLEDLAAGRYREITSVRDLLEDEEE